MLVRRQRPPGKLIAMPVKQSVGQPHASVILKLKSCTTPNAGAKPARLLNLKIRSASGLTIPASNAHTQAPLCTTSLTPRITPQFSSIGKIWLRFALNTTRAASPAQRKAKSIATRWAFLIPFTSTGTCGPRGIKIMSRRQQINRRWSRFLHRLWARLLLRGRWPCNTRGIKYEAAGFGFTVRRHRRIRFHVASNHAAHKAQAPAHAGQKEKNNGRFARTFYWP